MAGHGEQVSGERLRQLLDQGEGVDLDFKATCDLNARAELVAISKDIAALGAAGGHLLVGVEEDGSPSGRFTDSLAALFDEATLRAKIAPAYLPASISITTAVHRIEGHPVAVVYVAAHTDGFVVMQRDGDYQDRHGRPAQAFRAGDVYVRRGSATHRWSQAEAQAALERAMAARRERWRAELREDLIGLGLARQAQQIAHGPAAGFTWQLDNEAFSASLVELLRAGDEIAITLAFDAIRRDVSTAWIANRLDDVTTILDRLCSAAAIAIAVSRQSVFERAVEGLVHVYNLPYDANGLPRADPRARPPAALWLEVVTRVYGAGALAVRRRDWSAVKGLALQTGRGREFDWYTNWLRAALTEGSRAGLLQTHEGDRRIELSLLGLAAEHIARLAPLRPDLPPDDEAVISSLTQFDVLAILAAIARARTLDDRGWYTNFARYDWTRSEPALVALLQDSQMRAQLFPLDDDVLAAAIREISRMARSEGFRFSVWNGWQSEIVNRFLSGHPDAQP